MKLDPTTLKAVIEAVLFAASEPITINDIKKLIKSKTQNKDTQITEEISETVVIDQISVAHNDNQLEAANEEIVPPENNVVEMIVSAEVTTNESIEEIVAEISEETDPLAQLQQMQSELDQELSKSEIKNVLVELMNEYESNETRGFELVEVAGGYQFRTKLKLAEYVREVSTQAKARLSTPGMETLAIIAYQQPVSRNKVEEIRGVDSGGVLKNLLEKDLVRIVGRSDEPGKPILYGTSKRFLEVFSLDTLSELPTLKDLEIMQETIRSSRPESDDDLELSESDELRAYKDENEGEELMATLDSESTELIGELESSMMELKNIEKDIFATEETSKESAPQEGENPQQ